MSNGEGKMSQWFSLSSCFQLRLTPYAWSYG
jgi:hypothetical protein